MRRSTAILEERPFFLQRLADAAARAGRDRSERGRRSRPPVHRGDDRSTGATGCARLAIPFEWQSAVIRAAITLQLQCVRRHRRDRRRDDHVDARGRRDVRATGTIATAGCATATSSSTRSTVSARPKRWKAICDYIVGIAAAGGEVAAARLSDQRRPRARRGDREVAARLSRHGAGARSATTPTGRSSTTSTAPRCSRPRTCSSTSGSSKRGDAVLFERLEALGRRALAVFDQPDAGLWELRGKPARAHVLERDVLGGAATGCRASRRASASTIARARGAAMPSASTAFIEERCWSESRRASPRTAGGDADGCEPAAPRRPRLPRAGRSAVRARPCAPSSASSCAATSCSATSSSDDFGVPENAFMVCTFWYVNAAAALGRRDEARALFERLARLPQRARPPGRARRPAHRRALGQLRADLQHGRAHQLRPSACRSAGIPPFDRASDLTARAVSGAPRQRPRHRGDERRTPPARRKRRPVRRR